MVLPIGFFMPLPLAMMIPFMGIQSAVMAKQFGENFQYGKRRISAMSNEEFNKLTPEKLQNNANAELKSMIPSMQEAVIEMRTFQTFLISEFIKMIGDALNQGFSDVFGINPFGEHSHETTGPAPPVPPPIGGTPIPPPTTPKPPPNLVIDIPPETQGPPKQEDVTYSVTFQDCSQGNTNSTVTVKGYNKSVTRVAQLLDYNRKNFGNKGCHVLWRAHEINAWSAKYPIVVKKAMLIVYPT